MDIKDTSLYGTLGNYCHDLQTDASKEGQLQVSAWFCFPGEYIGFGGHFPGQPVLPAIAQLAAVRYMAEEAVGKKMMLQGYKKAKFRGMVVPDDKFFIVLLMDECDDKWAGQFTIAKSDDSVVASGFLDLVFTKSDV